MKFNRWIYWIITILFCLIMFGAGVSELAQTEVIINSLKVIGFPTYILPLLGTLKILGAITLLVPTWQTLKEWAYAGFTFDFVGAIYSFAIVRPDFQMDFIFAPVCLFLCLTSYVFYRLQSGNADLT